MLTFHAGNLKCNKIVAELLPSRTYRLRKNCKLLHLFEPRIAGKICRVAMRRLFCLRRPSLYAGKDPMRMLWFVVFLIAFTSFAVLAQEPRPLALMPWPANVKFVPGNGQLLIDTSFAVGVEKHADPALRKTVAIFLDDLRRHTGTLPLDFSVTAPETAQLAVHRDRPSKKVQQLGEDESYSLEITPAGAKLSAPTTLGVMRGLQTFLQLIETTPQGFAVPTVVIEDKPRFAWRGLMIDSSRHFIPVEVIKRNLDAMAAVKLNVLHWHLSDNQGFRVESKRFPKLQGMGSDGLLYTQDQVREIIAYAHDRGIRVVPEFDMPGHSTAWFVGYPELASGPGPYQIWQAWGVADPAMNPTDEKTYKFLNELFAEMGKIFPDQYFHIGGDEVNGKEWDANPNIQEFMKSHNIKNNEGLQAYFSQRVQELVVKHGKTPVGWDEILVPGVPKSIVIQSWRGSEALATAAREGYRGILSNGYYIDLGWSAARHYAVDPMAGAAASLTPAEKERILGGEATMWSEYVNWENIDSRVWPRTAAIAERYWSAENTTDVASMYSRMEAESLRLEWLGLTHRSYQRRMVERMAGSGSVEQIA